MVTRIANIERDAKGASLLLPSTEGIIKISLDEDNPNNVKGAFNVLIKDLKKGLFNFILEDELEDLYNQVCNEYLKQLNKEMGVIYRELVNYKLVEA